MGLLLFVLVVAIGFTWLTARAVRAGFGKPIFWLAWFCIGACVTLSVELPGTELERFLVQLWAYSLIGLPLWWAIQAMRRRNGRAS